MNSILKIIYFSCIAALFLWLASCKSVSRKCNRNGVDLHLLPLMEISK